MEDPIFLSLLNDILLSIVSSKVPGVYEATVEQALPRLTASIGNYNANESWAAASALDLLGSLARGAPETGLGEGFFAAIAPTIFECLGVAEDRDVLQVQYSFPTYSPVPGPLTWMWLERDITPDARRAEGRWPTPFMDAHGWPNGSRTRVYRHCSLAAEPRRVWGTRDRRPHHPPFPTRGRECAPRAAGPLAGDARAHADGADGDVPAELDHPVRFLGL